jgi:sterol 3beta-glucosyltransferase
VRLGLPPISSAALRERADHLALFAFSRAVLPPQPSWPKHYHVTGFFFLDDTGWQPDHGLTMFLQAGPPPVVISLGSTMHDDPAQLTALFLATISAVGCRAVLQRGWSGLAQDAPLPDSVYAVDYVPHEWLLPRAACVVHHGGAGTLAAVMRAGVPMVVIPHTGDQFILARHAQNLGSAGPVCPYQALNVNQLSAAIAATLTDPRYHTAALAVRERIRAEQGVQTARMLIEQFAHTA